MACCNLAIQAYKLAFKAIKLARLENAYLQAEMISFKAINVARKLTIQALKLPN